MMCPSDLCDDDQNQNDISGVDKGGENHSDNPEERQETKEDIISGRNDSRQNDIRRGLGIVLLIIVIIVLGAVVPIFFLTHSSRQQSKDEMAYQSNIIFSNPPPETETQTNYLQAAVGGDEVSLQPNVDIDSIPSEGQNTHSIQEIRSTADVLQACVCNVNGRCLSKNIVLKNDILFICVYHHEEGGDADQIYRLQQITSMNITHSTTLTIFEPITSEYSGPDNNMSKDLTATYMSPWVTVESYDDSTLMIIRLQQLLGIWFDYKESTIDIDGEVLVQAEEGVIMGETGTNLLGSDVVLSKQSTEYFHLTALLMDQPCESSIDGNLSVSIHDESSIVFACTCDSSNSCHDLNIEVPVVGSPPSIRICIVPQQRNGSVAADIVRITQLKLVKEGLCGFPFEVVNDGAVSPLARIEQVVEDESTGVIMLVATIKLLSQQVLNPSPITVYGAAEVKLPNSQLQEVPFGTLRYAVDEPTIDSNKMAMDSCQCDDSNYSCIVEPSPLSPSELRLQLCLFARPQTSKFVSESVDVLMVQNTYKNVIVKSDLSVGTGTTILFKNETMMVIETYLERAVFERSLNYVEVNSYAGLESASLSSDVTSDLRLPLYIEPSNMPSAFPSLSPRPTFNGPTFKPTQSNEPTEEQTIRLEYCPCDSDEKCLGVGQVTLTPYERNIRICFKTLPSNSQVVGTPILASNSAIPFTTLLDSELNGGLIAGEFPEELFESSVGTSIEVIGKFNIREGDRNATLGLTVVYKIGSVESSSYCSSTRAQLKACACQCNDDNNCVDGLVQTSSSRDVRICVFSAPTGSKIDQIDTLYFEYTPTKSMQIVIRDDKPASAGTAMTPAGNATLRIITTSLMEDFFSDLTSARVVEAKGSATVLPDSGAFGQAVVINVVDLTVGQEPTANPTNSPTSNPTFDPTSKPSTNEALLTSQPTNLSKVTDSTTSSPTQETTNPATTNAPTNPPSAPTN
ncbi:hypothetical protein ACHAXM_000478, partial [Skeletonema potamos]